MPGRGRRRSGPPARIPHPDPVSEAKLLRITALRESAARQAGLCAQYASEVERLSAEFRRVASNSVRPGERTPALEERIKSLQGEMARLETSVAALQSEIALSVADLNETELAHL